MQQNTSTRQVLVLPYNGLDTKQSYYVHYSYLLPQDEKKKQEVFTDLSCLHKSIDRHARVTMAMQYCNATMNKHDFVDQEDLYPSELQYISTVEVLKVDFRAEGKKLGQVKSDMVAFKDWPLFVRKNQLRSFGEDVPCKEKFNEFIEKKDGILISVPAPIPEILEQDLFYIRPAAYF